MIMLALAAVSAAPATEQLDVHKLQLPEAVFACQSPSHKVDFLLLRREAGLNYVSFLSNANGTLFRAPVTSASGTHGVSVELEAEGAKKGEHASVSLRSGQSAASFVLTINERLSGTCRFVPMVAPATKNGANQ